LSSNAAISRERASLQGDISSSPLPEAHHLLYDW
jgi:hypothetical protein